MAESDNTQEVQRLFVANIASVKHYVLSILPNPSEADDIVQEVFITATAKANDFQVGTNFTAWVLTIARFKVMELLRREKRDRNRLSDAVMELLADEAELFQADERVETFAALKVCVTKLSPKPKSMIEMLYQDEMKPAEIAERMGWAPGGVYVALSRARSQLRTCVKKELKQAAAR